MSGETSSIVWLRRDLRLEDHSSFSAATKAGKPIQPIFVFDADILKGFPNKKDRRLSFIAAALCQMDIALKKLHPQSGVLLLHGSAQEIVPKLAEALKAEQVFAGEDYEPNTIKRDQTVGEALEASGRMLKLACDHLLVAADAILKNDGTPYKVFTPFSKVWRAQLTKEAIAEREVVLTKELLGNLEEARSVAQQAGLKVLDAAQGEAALLSAVGYDYTKDDFWPADGGKKRLRAFIEKRIGGYPETRDQLFLEDGTSQISPYLRFGLISVREAARLAIEQEGHEKWLAELAWRDFYAMILYRFPDSETHEFQEKYRELEWSENEAAWQAFIESRTGFPVVDAAMRQLHEIGWMHNRARMIVASFLTKDLLIDWRWGEAHFAQWLMDYDMASNVGGWQWAASTGTDAQPYFRIFNPTSQSERFDPKGEYIRRWLPELQEVSDKEIHEPHKGGLFGPKDYPEPMVDHKEARQMALRLFKEV